MKPSEIILLLGLSIFSGLLLYGSLDMPYFSEQSFGPGFVPLNIAVVVILLSGLHLAISCWKRSKKTTEGGEEEHTESSPSYSSIPLVVIALLALTALAMELGSIILPLFVLLTIISTVFLGNRIRKSIVSSSLVLLAIYLIFGIWLKIPLI